MEALIFDLDGTLVQSEKVHGKAFFKALDQLGVDYETCQIIELLKESQGAPDSYFARRLIEKYDLDISEEKFLQLKRNNYANLIETDVEAFPGAVDFVKSFEGKYKLALASSSSEEDIENVLKKIGLFETFDVRVSGSKLENPKPHPDIFLLTAKKLGVDIRNCVIFEDSFHGLTAAKRSGGKVIAYNNKQEDNEYIRDYYVIEDYRKVGPKKLEEVFEKMEEK